MSMRFRSDGHARARNWMCTLNCIQKQIAQCMLWLVISSLLKKKKKLLQKRCMAALNWKYIFFLLHKLTIPPFL